MTFENMEKACFYFFTYGLASGLGAAAMMWTWHLIIGATKIGFDGFEP